jgi:hypothetical protein
MRLQSASTHEGEELGGHAKPRARPGPARSVTFVPGFYDVPELYSLTRMFRKHKTWFAFGGTAIGKWRWILVVWLWNAYFGKVIWRPLEKREYLPIPSCLLWRNYPVWTLCDNSVGYILYFHAHYMDCLCGLVVRVVGYRSGGPGSIPGTTRFSEK